MLFYKKIIQKSHSQLIFSKIGEIFSKCGQYSHCFFISSHIFEAIFHNLSQLVTVQGYLRQLITVYFYSTLMKNRHYREKMFCKYLLFSAIFYKTVFRCFIICFSSFLFIFYIVFISYLFVYVTYSFLFSSIFLFLYHFLTLYATYSDYDTIQ